MISLTNLTEHIILELLLLSEQERLDILDKFCGSCGKYTVKEPCQCWNQK